MASAISRSGSVEATAVLDGAGLLGDFRRRQFAGAQLGESGQAVFDGLLAVREVFHPVAHFLRSIGVDDHAADRPFRLECLTCGDLVAGACSRA